MRHGLGAPNDGHEVRVARPPRHDVLVQVASDSGTGDVSLVHANVESVRSANPAYHTHGGLCELREFGGFRLVDIGVVGHMAVRADHKMAWVVRI